MSIYWEEVVCPEGGAAPSSFSGRGTAPGVAEAAPGGGICPAAMPRPHSNRAEAGWGPSLAAGTKPAQPVALRPVPDAPSGRAAYKSRPGPRGRRRLGQPRPGLRPSRWVA